MGRVCGQYLSGNFIRRQTRTILVILDLYASPESAKQRNGELWETTENAISFAATLVKRYTEYGDSQLYFTLNADIPEPASKDGKQKESAARNDAPTDWDSVAGGGSLRRVFTKLALASAPDGASADSAEGAVSTDSAPSTAAAAVAAGATSWAYAAGSIENSGASMEMLRTRVSKNTRILFILQKSSFSDPFAWSKYQQSQNRFLYRNSLR